MDPLDPAWIKLASAIHLPASTTAQGLLLREGAGEYRGLFRAACRATTAAQLLGLSPPRRARHPIPLIPVSDIDKIFCTLIYNVITRKTTQ